MSPQPAKHGEDHSFLGPDPYDPIIEWLFASSDSMSLAGGSTGVDVTWGDNPVLYGHGNVSIGKDATTEQPQIYRPGMYLIYAWPNFGVTGGTNPVGQTECHIFFTPHGGSPSAFTGFDTMAGGQAHADASHFATWGGFRYTVFQPLRVPVEMWETAGKIIDVNVRISKDAAAATDVSAELAILRIGDVIHRGGTIVPGVDG